MQFQEHLVEALAGSAIFALGVLSLCANFGTIFSRERILLWFGLFAVPYGMAPVLRSIFLSAWDGRAEPPLVVFGKLIGLLANISALLLFREFYGAGWRLSMRWLIWMYAVTLAGIICLTAIHERPDALPSPGLRAPAPLSPVLRALLHSHQHLFSSLH
jgi:hypothetical protein